MLPTSSILSPKQSLIPDILLSSSKISNTSIDEILLDALRVIRLHFDMEVAFISEFAAGRRLFRYVDTATENSPVVVGASNPLEESYCQRVVDGRLPELIQDASLVPAALELPVTMTLPVGAHLSVAICLGSGEIYGTFCCFSTKPDFTLDERDLVIMNLFANFASQQIERQLKRHREQEEIVKRITSMLDIQAFHLVYQPIFDIAQSRIIGFEMLTRFTATPSRTPDMWFREAAAVGLGEQLEIAVIQRALADIENFPEDVYVSINVSPATILSGAITEVLHNFPLRRIVLEVTEHVAIPDYSHFSTILEPMRYQGLRLAIDDAGAGYASFRHILQLKPDLIKLDIELIRNIDTDYERRALAGALICFAKETGSKIIAEGVETQAELDTLRKLEVNKAQGYFLGRPLPITDAIELLRSKAEIVRPEVI